MPRCKELPWERQEGESAPAFEAFSIYRDLGTGRSLQQVSQQLSKSVQLMKRWSSAWEWGARTLAYDRHLDAKKREKAVKAVQQMMDRHIRISMQMQEKAVKALVDIDTEKLSPQLILSFLTKATDIERKNRLGELGYDVDKSGKTAPATATAPPEEDEPETDITAIRRKMDEMSDEQLAQYEALCSMFNADEDDMGA